MRKLTSEDFINKAKTIHGNKYDYSKSFYVGAKIKLIITCPVHGDFEQTPTNHLHGFNCCSCGNEKIGNIKRKTIEDFIKQASIKHNNFYSYENVEYKNSFKNIIITCPIHGDFDQSPSNHLSGKGCSSCNSSRGENEIRNFLKEKNMLFKEQVKFENCKNIKQLPFDFGIYNEKEELLCLIEYDGVQHYKPKDFFGGEKQFIKQKELDNIKTLFCEENSIKLFRIGYKNQVLEELDKIVNL